MLNNITSGGGEIDLLSCSQPQIHLPPGIMNMTQGTFLNSSDAVM
jgi:hypothetical protein